MMTKRPDLDPAEFTCSARRLVEEDGPHAEVGRPGRGPAQRAGRPAAALRRASSQIPQPARRGRRPQDQAQLPGGDTGRSVLYPVFGHRSTAAITGRAARLCETLES
jgi:hypothetical protein